MYSLEDFHVLPLTLIQPSIIVCKQQIKRKKTTIITNIDNAFKGRKKSKCQNLIL